MKPFWQSPYRSTVHIHIHHLLFVWNLEKHHHHPSTWTLSRMAEASRKHILKLDASFEKTHKKRAQLRGLESPKVDVFPNRTRGEWPSHVRLLEGSSWVELSPTLTWLGEVWWNRTRQRGTKELMLHETQHFPNSQVLSFTCNFKGVYYNVYKIHSIQDATSFFVMIYPRPVVISPAGIHQRPGGSIGSPQKIPIWQEVVSYIK